MSRDITATNLAEINSSHLHEVVLVKLDYTTPVYCHSGFGTIVYDSNSYVGVGQFGGISGGPEAEKMRPSPLTLTLSGVDSNLISEGLDAGTYGDAVTVYLGYRQDDGNLVDDPEIIFSGTLEYASVRQGANNTIAITVQHDLAVLNEKDGGRFTDEDQQVRFTGDVAFEYLTDQDVMKQNWGGRRIGGSGGGVAPFPGRPNIRREPGEGGR